MWFFIVGSILPCVLGAYVGKGRGRVKTGFVLGLLLSYVGVLAAFFLPPDRSVQCSQCGGVLAAGFVRCRLCGADVTLQEEAYQPPPETPTQHIVRALLCSLVLPGAGQWHNKQQVKAVLIGAPSVLGCIMVVVDYVSGMGPMMDQIQDMVMSGVDTTTIATRVMGHATAALGHAEIWISICGVLYVVALMDAGVVAWLQERAQQTIPPAESNA